MFLTKFGTEVVVEISEACCRTILSWARVFQSIGMLQKCTHVFHPCHGRKFTPTKESSQEPNQYSLLPFLICTTETGSQSDFLPRGPGSFGEKCIASAPWHFKTVASPPWQCAVSHELWGWSWHIITSLPCLIYSTALTWHQWHLRLLPKIETHLKAHHFGTWKCPVGHDESSEEPLTWGLWRIAPSLKLMFSPKGLNL